LRGRKENVSPRSLRFQLAPGEPPRVIVEPWNEEIVFERSDHGAAVAQEIRVWGRRRLLMLQRVLPAAERVTAWLQGSGRPWFLRVEAGAVELLLGMSPWAERDWTADALPIAPRVEPAAERLARAETVVARREELVVEELAEELGVGIDEALALMDALAVRGRVLYEP